MIRTVIVMPPGNSLRDSLAHVSLKVDVVRSVSAITASVKQSPNFLTIHPRGMLRSEVLP